MSRQQDLFEGVPYVVSSSTSRAAADSVKDELPRLEAEVLAAIRARGEHGATDDEIEQATGLRHQTASARRRGLVLKKLIVADGDKTRKTRSGRAAQVWRVA